MPSYRKIFGILDSRTSPTLEPEVRRHLRKSLGMLLRKIKEIAGTAGLLYRPA